MKKVLSLAVITAILISLIPAFPVLAEKQYLTNSGFDNQKTGWMTNWQEGSGTCDVEEGDFGNNVLHMQTDAGKVYMQQNVKNLQPGDRLTLYFDLNIVGLVEGGSATVYIGYTDINGANMHQHNFSYYEPTDGFETKSIDFIMPANAYGIGVLIRLLEGGDIYYDNVELYDTNNKTTLTVSNHDLVLDRIPYGVKSVTANLHYVPEEAGEQGNLIFASYKKNSDGSESLIGMEIAPFAAAAQICKKATLEIPDDVQDVVVKAYVWKNGDTLKPVAQSITLPREGRSPVYDRFVAERMRGAYGATTVFYDDAKMQQLLDAGINTFIFNIGYNGDGENVNQNLPLLDEMCSEIEKFIDETGSIVFMKGSYGARSVVTNNIHYGAYHPGQAHSYVTPCPLMQEYWEAEMLSRFEIVARHPKIQGIVFDMEMYSGGTTNYVGSCMCDSCVAKFAEANGSEAAKALVETAADERREFAKKNKIYTAYNQWHASVVTQITTSLREKIHAINPNLIIGMMPTYEWLNGMGAGLGTEKMPLMVFGENEYRGKIETAYFHLAQMERMELPVVYTVGLWSSTENAIAPENFAAKITQAGTIGMGYWIYAIHEMDADESFYTELKKGNQQLDEKLGLK